MHIHTQRLQTYTYGPVALGSTSLKRAGSLTGKKGGVPDRKRGEERRQEQNKWQKHRRMERDEGVEDGGEGERGTRKKEGKKYRTGIRGRRNKNCCPAKIFCCSAQMARGWLVQGSP
jgi:hypothetical protein